MIHLMVSLLSFMKPRVQRLSVLVILSLYASVIWSFRLTETKPAHLSRTRSPRISSSLNASLQFKNVEQMLEKFGDEPVLIVFTATNCGPCKLQRKELSSVRQNLQFTMVAIDTDRWPNVGSRFHVGKLPCLVGLKHGEELLRLEGLRSADEIISNMRSLV